MSLTSDVVYIKGNLIMQCYISSQRDAFDSVTPPNGVGTRQNWSKYHSISVPSIHSVSVQRSGGGRSDTTLCPALLPTPTWTGDPPPIPPTKKRHSGLLNDTELSLFGSWQRLRGSYGSHKYSSIVAGIFITIFIAVQYLLSKSWQTLMGRCYHLRTVRLVVFPCIWVGLLRPLTLCKFSKMQISWKLICKKGIAVLFIKEADPQR